MAEKTDKSVTVEYVCICQAKDLSMRTTEATEAEAFYQAFKEFGATVDEVTIVVRSIH